jgi:hypothetical protein
MEHFLLQKKTLMEKILLKVRLLLKEFVLLKWEVTLHFELAQVVFQVLLVDIQELFQVLLHLLLKYL